MTAMHWAAIFLSFSLPFMVSAQSLRDITFGTDSTLDVLDLEHRAFPEERYRHDRLRGPGHRSTGCGSDRHSGSARQQPSVGRWFAPYPATRCTWTMDGGRVAWPGCTRRVQLRSNLSITSWIHLPTGMPSQDRPWSSNSSLQARIGWPSITTINAAVMGNSIPTIRATRKTGGWKPTICSNNTCC